LNSSFRRKPQGWRSYAVAALLLGASAVSSPDAAAQYVQRYNGITNGAVTFTGNTLGLNKAANANNPGTAGSIGAFSTLNAALQDGGYPAGTTADWRLNGAAAQLDLPAGSTVLYAELIWSGSYSYGGENVSANLSEPVTFVTPAGTFSVAPDPTTSRTLGTGTPAGACTSTIPCFYVRSANVTTQVRSGGAGSYSTGRVPATQGNADNNSNAAGWTLAVVYQNGGLPSRNLTVYVGSEVTNATITTTATVSGFCTPTSGAQSGRLLVSALEGDPQITGDQMQFGPTVGTLAALSGTNNGATNFFASQINRDNGSLDTRGTFGTRNSTVGTGVSGARQGYDITNVDVSARLVSGQTSAIARGTSTGDQYIINALGLQIQVGAPVFLVPVKQVDKATTFVGDTLTYTIRLDNTTGTADALNVRFRDVMPAGTSFVADSFAIGGVAQPGASPVTGVDVGNVPVGRSVTVSYRVRVDSIPAAPAVAEYQQPSGWTYNFVSCAGQPVTNGAITTNPVVTRVPRVNAIKTVSPTGAVLAGQVLTYTITVNSDGTANTIGTTLRDAIPAGTSYVAGSTTLNAVAVADVAGAMPFAAERTINGPGRPPGQINVGEAAVVRFQVRVNDGFVGDVLNSARIDVDGAGGAAPITAQVTNSSRLPPVLTVSKLTVGVLTRGGNGVFLLAVSNAAGAGSTDGSAVVVTDTLPAGLTLSAAPSGPGWTCTPSGNAFSCTRADLLAAGASYPPISLNVTVAQDAPGSITNTASVQGGGDATPATGSVTIPVESAANLSVSKVADNNNPTIGANVVFTLRVRNAGPSDATDVRVNDLLPAGLSFVSASSNLGNYDAGSGVWTIGTLANGGAGELRITATFTGPGQVTNIATITATEPDPNPGDNTSQVTVPSQVADLALTKAVDNAAPIAGANVRFTLTLRNTGPAAATGVTVNDLLPTGLGFVAATPSAGSYTAGSGVWNIGALAAGSSATLQLEATVSGTGSITNVARVASADQFDPNSRPGNDNPLEDDQAAATLTPQGADLGIAKGVDRANPNIGDTVAFTLTVTNAGPSPASGVTATDQLPAGLTFLSASASQGSYSSGNGQWSVGTVAVGAIATLTIRARFDGPGQVTNVATVTSALPDANPANNSSQLTVPSQVADLSLAKSVDTAAPNVGAAVTFTLVAANAGPNTATGVEVEDRLPAGLEFLSATASQGSYSNASGRWTLGSVANGALATLQIVARVTGSTPLVNTAQVARADQFDPNSTPGNGNAGENDQSSAPITPQSADLSMAKSVDVANPNVGDTVRFTLQVNNAGPTAAQAVAVEDRLPAGLGFVSASATRGSYDAASGQWTIGALGAGASATLTITATFIGPNQVTNVARVSSPTPDANPANNSAQVSVPSQIADLTLAKTVNVVAPDVGSVVAFTVTLRNAGPNTATNVRVADSLPQGLSFVSSSASQGSYAAGSGVWSVGAVASGASATLTVNATVTGSAPVTNTAEVATSDQFDPTSRPGNGDADEDDQASVAVVPQQADLAMSKSVDLPNPNIGQTVRFRLTVSNVGPTAARGIVVDDLLPTGLTFQSATASQGSYANATGIWTVGGLNNSQSATLEIAARFDGPTQVNNIATVRADTPDPNLGNNRSSVAIPSQIADLSLTKAASTTAPNVGADVAYTITVRNAGPNSATGVVVGEPIPAGASFVSAATSQGSYNPTSGAWTVGAVASGATAALELVLRITAATPVTNTAQVVASDQFDPNSTPNNNNAAEDDQARVVVTPQSADLSIAKTVDNPNPTLGQQIGYRLTVRNDGPTAASGVRIEDRLPAGLTFVSAAPSRGTYDEVSGNWTVGTLDAGANASLLIVATFQGPDRVTNVATVVSDVPDPDGGNNRAEITVPSQLADLSVGKSVDNAAPNRGENVTFTITVQNRGPATATGVRVSEPLASGLSFVSAAPSQGSYDPVTGLWLVGSLAADANASATLSVVATVTGVGAITNVAELIALDQFDPDSTPNNGAAGEDDRASVTLAGQSVDLSLSKTVDNGSPNVGNSINYTVTVRNAGPSNATGVVIADPLPAGVTFQQALASVGSYDAASGRWTIGTVIAGGAVTLTLRVRVDVATPVTNTASVAAVDQPDANPGNDRDSVTVPQQSADVSLGKTVDTATPNVGGLVTFTLAVDNAGPNSATNLRVVDPLPEGLEFVAATPSQGSFAAATGTWSVGTLASGARATLSLQTRVTRAGPITNVAEISDLDQRDPDATPGNGVPGEDDRASVDLIGQSADLSMAKAADRPQPLIGENVVYTLTVSNAGPTAAADVRVEDTLPPEVTFVSATSATGSYDAAAGLWTIGTLASGARAELRITVTYIGPGQAVNTATVRSSTPDPDLSGNTATVTVPTQTADLSLTKTLLNTTPRIGETITFNLIVRNDGPAAATGVRVSDRLEASLQLLTAFTNVGVYSADTGIWSLGTLARGDSAGLQIEARLLAAGPGSNTAEITAADQFDPNSTPNNGVPGENDRGSVSWTASGASLTGTVYIDVDNDGSFDAGEPGIAGVALTLTGVDRNGTRVERNAVTDASGNYRFSDLAGAGSTGYTVTQVQPGGYLSGATSVGTAGGTAAVNTVTSVPLGLGQAGTGYDFGELGSTLSGSVWLDTQGNRQREPDERGLDNWIVELLDTGGAVVRTVRTDATGRYSIEGLAPGSYQLRFREPGSNVIWGSPVNGERGNPQAGSSLAASREALALTINPGENKIEQSLPVDPSGVVYDSVSRELVSGATVTFCGPAGFTAATQLVGGASYQAVPGQANCASMTVGTLAFYQFFLVPSAPAGTYTLSVTPPSGYRASTNLLPESQPLAPPAGAGPFRVQPQSTPPQPGAATTYYFTLSLSGAARDVLNNHIPLDSLTPTQLSITKAAASTEVELGDSVAYEIRVQSVSGPSLPLVVITDRLPAGFRYIAGTGRLQIGSRPAELLADPAGLPGPVLTFTLRSVPGRAALPAGETAVLRYRLRVGVGAQQGDGVNRARAASGFVQSNEARARVVVRGGVFGSEACVVGKIYVDCNENRVQDHEEVGVPGVRMYFEDGTYLVSDVEGKYSYCGLKPTTHVLKVDATTLPVGAVLDTVDNRNAGDPDSRFVDLRNGELHRADFHIRSCSAEVIGQVMGRRTQGEVQVPDIEKSAEPVETLDPRRDVRCAQPRGRVTDAQCRPEVSQ
jgi:uncharacterized repeat protein (TIGR01451 family)